jgi:hypothetical protein
MEILCSVRDLINETEGTESRTEEKKKEKKENNIKIIISEIKRYKERIPDDVKRRLEEYSEYRRFAEIETSNDNEAFLKVLKDDDVFKNKKKMVGLLESKLASSVSDFKKEVGCEGMDIDLVKKIIELYNKLAKIEAAEDIQHVINVLTEYRTNNILPNLPQIKTLSGLIKDANANANSDSDTKMNYIFSEIDNIEGKNTCKTMLQKAREYDQCEQLCPDGTTLTAYMSKMNGAKTIDSVYTEAKSKSNKNDIIEYILDKFDERIDINDDKLKPWFNTCQTIRNKFGTVDDKDIAKILSTYDKLFEKNSSETLSQEWLQYCVIGCENKDKDTVKYAVGLYGKLKELNKNEEKGLLDLLKTCREKKLPNLPEPQSLGKTYTKLLKENKLTGNEKDEIIRLLLQETDKFLNKKDELSSTFDNYKRALKKYKQCNDLVIQMPDNKSFYEYLKDEIAKYGSHQDIIHSVEFAQLFKAQGIDNRSKEDILTEYNSIQTLIENSNSLYKSICKKPDKIDYWDRIAICIWSISKVTFPLLRIKEADVYTDNNANFLIDALKTDLLHAYIAKHFESAKHLDEFKSALEIRIPETIVKYNDRIKQNLPNMCIDPNSIKLDEEKSALLEKFGQISNTQNHQEFVDKMWQYFIKDFLSKASTFNQPYRGDSSSDKTWFFEQLFNIAYYAIDYIHWVHEKGGMVYFYNYYYLHNDMNRTTDLPIEFEYENPQKSTPYSTYVYKRADELGIAHLKIIIDRYLIKP